MMAGRYVRASLKLVVVALVLLAICITVNFKKADFSLAGIPQVLRRIPSPPPTDRVKLNAALDVGDTTRRHTPTSRDGEDYGGSLEHQVDDILWRTDTSDYDDVMGDVTERDDEFFDLFNVADEDEQNHEYKEEAEPLTKTQLDQAERLEHLREACRALHLAGQDITSASFNDSALFRTFDRVFVIHKYKLIYFFIPKVSTTSWKRLLLVLHGFEMFRDPTQVKYNAHRFAMTKFERFANIPVERAKQILKEYKSFVFVRNPYTRLLSAYQSKILNPGKDEIARKAAIYRWLRTHPPPQEYVPNQGRYPNNQVPEIGTGRRTYDKYQNVDPRRYPHNPEPDSRLRRYPSGNYSNFNHMRYIRAPEISHNTETVSRLRRYPPGNYSNFNHMRYIRAPEISHNPETDTRLRRYPSGNYSNFNHMRYIRAPEISFPQFVHYYLKTNNQESDIHWRDMYYISHPCTVKFSFIGHFETLKSDSDYILDLVNAPSDIRFPSQELSVTGSSSQDTMEKYYSQLSDSQFYELSNSPGFKRDLMLFGYKMPTYLRRKTNLLH